MGRMSGKSDSLQTPVRFVRYWLTGMIPLIAQSTAADQDRVDTGEVEESFSGDASAAEVGTAGAIGKYGAAGDHDSDARVGGLYRGEFEGGTMSLQLRSLRGQSSPENLTDRSFGEPSNLSGSNGLDHFEEKEPSEEVLRSSFHLSQVEWAKFRYFDGNQWSSTWDSRLRGELPVAIELSLWLLRINAKQATDQETTQNSPASGTARTWAGTETLSEPKDAYSIAEQEPQVDGGELSSVGDDNPMERQPEIRQLVVLRSAPLSGEPLQGNGLSSDNSLSDGIRGDDLRRGGLLKKSVSERKPNLSSPFSVHLSR